MCIKLDTFRKIEVTKLTHDSSICCMTSKRIIDGFLCKCVPVHIKCWFFFLLLSCFTCLCTPSNGHLSNDFNVHKTFSIWNLIDRFYTVFVIRMTWPLNDIRFVFESCSLYSVFFFLFIRLLCLSTYTTNLHIQLFTSTRLICHYTHTHININARIANSVKNLGNGIDIWLPNFDIYIYNWGVYYSVCVWRAYNDWL